MSTITGNVFKRESLQAGIILVCFDIKLCLFSRSGRGSWQPWWEGGVSGPGWLLSFTNYHLGEDDTNKACHVRKLPQATRQLSHRLVLKNMPLK